MLACGVYSSTVRIYFHMSLYFPLRASPLRRPALCSLKRYHKQAIYTHIGIIAIIGIATYTHHKKFTCACTVMHWNLLHASLSIDYSYLSIFKRINELFLFYLFYHAHSCANGPCMARRFFSANRNNSLMTLHLLSISRYVHNYV